MLAHANQQHHTREVRQHLQTLACLILHGLNSAARGNDYNVLLGNDRSAAVICEHWARAQPLPQSIESLV